MRSPQFDRPRAAAMVIAGVVCLASVGVTHGSDHLDTPTVATNPRTDIADLYAWMSSDARELNLVMTIVGHSFSENVAYTFHVDSGDWFGRTTATAPIVCRPAAARVMDCRAGKVDRARGDASTAQGLRGKNGRFRVYAGLRDDPFFNNVKGTRAAYQVAAAALQKGAAVDGAGCPAFDPTTTGEILSTWQHTDGGPAANLLAGWSVAALVVSIDFDAVATGGRILAVWATTSSEAGQLDRVGRPLTGNALLATLGPGLVSEQLKEQYNRATPATSARFIPEIEKSLGLYDGFDGKCGNQLLADNAQEGSARYRALATLLADDRLWVNGGSGVCTQLFAVERAHLAGEKALSTDCGGRSPNYPAANVYRSLLVDGTTTSINDGLERDERDHSATAFPFLAPPESAGNE